MLVVGKEASTLSTLHGIANCVKNGTRKIVSSNRYQRLARCSVAYTYFRSSLRSLFTVFLETKIQLWKLMWAISGCCIGSSGSLLHPPLSVLQYSSLHNMHLHLFSKLEHAFIYYSSLLGSENLYLLCFKKRNKSNLWKPSSSQKNLVP